MITEQALTEAIAYYKGKVDPTPNDAIVLAACYTITDHLDELKRVELPSYSMAYAPAEPVGNTTDFNSDTEFGRAVKGKAFGDIYAIFDELMDTLKVINPKLYNGVLRQIEA